jgi:D-alanyl-D-alanine-carboxypeptidase/D-alanyl-D-alanine-endopeptidase
MTKNLLIILFFLHPSLGQTQTVKQAIPTDNKLKSQIDTVVQKAAMPFIGDTSKVGLSIGIYKNGKVYSYNYGTTQRENPKLPTNKTVYEIGSISKTFTGTLLAQAVKDKKVKIDDDIRKYLDGSYPNLEYQGKPIKLSHLVFFLTILTYFKMQILTLYHLLFLKFNRTIQNKNSLTTYIQLSWTQFQDIIFITQMQVLNF